MNKRLFGLILSISTVVAYAQEEAVTSSGKVVLLFPDSTWKLKRVEVPDSAASDSTALDSLVIRKPMVKQYSDTTFGFKGFLKIQQFKLPPLPEYSDGLYEYRVKINKAGDVKEVITMKRGPNGATDQLIRSAIYNFKFRPDGSIVAPLTEGTFRVIIPAK
jgi:hypothetical protein